MSNHCQGLPSLVTAALLAACGRGSSSTTATVQLQPIGAFDGSAEVFVNSPTGSLVSRTAITDTLDVAITDGDTVTIGVYTDGETTLLSSLAVKRGDVISIPVASNEGSDNPTEVAVTMPTVVNVENWQIATPTSESSGPSSSPVTIDVNPGTTATPILGTAIDANDNAIAMFGETSATITGGSAAPTIALHDSVDFHAVALTTTGAPAGVTADDIFVDAEVFVGSDAVPIPELGSDAIMPTNFGGRVELAAFAFGSDNSVSVGEVLASAPTTAQSVDLSAPHVPQISQLALGASGPSWTLVGGGDYDYLTAGLTASTNDNYLWEVLAPPGTTAVVLPQLPSDVPAPAIDGLSVQAAEVSTVDGYDASLDEDVTALPPAGATFESRGTALAPAQSSARAKRQRHFCLTPVTFHD